MLSDSAGDGNFLREDASDDNLSNNDGKRPRGRRRRKSTFGAVSRLNEGGRGTKRPKFKRSPAKTHEVTLALTPRQAVVWLMNLDSISDLYEMTTGETLAQDSRAQLRAVLRALAREGSGAARH